MSLSRSILRSYEPHNFGSIFNRETHEQLYRFIGEEKEEKKKRGIDRHTLRAIERVKWPANFDTVWEAFVA